MGLLMVLQDSGWMNSPPGSMWFILLISLIISVVSVVLTKLLIDTKEMDRKQKQIKAHNEEKKKVIELAKVDVERYHKARKKWERRDIMLKKTQQGMAMDRMKPTLITFLPMIILFAILRGIYENAPVVASPMNPLFYGLLQWPIGMGIAEGTSAASEVAWLNFTAWYFICSLGINTLLQRILGLQTQASGGMEQMFTGQQTAAAQFPDV